MNCAASRTVAALLFLYTLLKYNFKACLYFILEEKWQKNSLSCVQNLF
jgi:hypothetical protein